MGFKTTRKYTQKSFDKCVRFTQKSFDKCDFDVIISYKSNKTGVINVQKINR
jgi:hypothetical protein